MELFILRHAHSPQGSPDSSRPLSDKGRSQAVLMADWFARHCGTVDAIVSSPYLRAKETADAMAVRLGLAVIEDRRLSSGMGETGGLEVIHEHGGAAARLMLVGHNPDFADLAGRLLGNGCIALPKAGMAAFSVYREGQGGSVLNWLLHPALLADR